MAVATIQTSEGESQFRIEATGAFREPRTRVLKHDDTFAVLNQFGDILGESGSPDGLYHRDTRQLSQLELRVNGDRPLLLSANPGEDNALLTVDLANPDMTDLDGAALHRELIYINRRQFVWENAYNELVLVRNFDVEPHAITLSLRFAADFVDVFEVRGQHRAKRGRRSAERLSDEAVVLRYWGLDGVERDTHLRFEPPPARLDTSSAQFILKLKGGEGTRIVLRVDCGAPSKEKWGVRRYYGALRAARHALRQASGRAASLEGSNAVFNELVRRSVADLYMLMTETPHGPYPYAGIPWYSTVFGRDGIITALLTLWTDPTIAKGVLSFLAAEQATEVAPERDAEPGKILHEMRQGEVQGYVYAAKRYAAELAGALGDDTMAARLTEAAETLRRQFDDAFWCDDLSTYAIALDGEKRPCRVITSNAGHALLTGIAAPDRAARVAETLFRVGSFSGWGIRTVAMSAVRYNPISYHNGSVWPHDNAMIALGLSRYDFKQPVLRILTGMFNAASYWEPRRLPELFCGFARRRTGPTMYPVACSPQAWASAAVLALVQASLGLQFDPVAREIRFEHPMLPAFLDHLHVRGLRLGDAEADVLLHRSGEEVATTVTRRCGKVRIVIVH